MRTNTETWAKRIVLVLLLALIVGVGISTVYRAGPYQSGGKE